MKTAIYTVVLNEQDYLEDWIEWHLNLGFTKIFIFQDIGSQSHKEICDRYPNVVLKPILDLFDDEEKPLVIKMKEEGKYRQSMYAKRGIMWIKNNNPDIDWLFSLDADEYICPERAFPSLLSAYNDLDGILIRWHNFNAAGRLKKPIYDKPIWEIYTQRCGYLKSDEKTKHYTKVAYNMKRVKEKLVWGCHTIPSRNTATVDDIHINHYFTKSWEEWCNKLHKRGMFCKYRKDEDFFELNPDLRDIVNNMQNCI